MLYFLKKNYILLFTSFLVGVFFLLIYSLTEVSGYQSISPLPGLESVDTGNPSGLIQYFNRIFVIFISIVAVLGVIKLMLCGFQYMTSEAISSKEEAKKCMTGVFGGLFLVLISVLVLQTINPKLIELTFFDTLQQRIGDVEFSIPDFGVDDDGGGVTNMSLAEQYNNRWIRDEGYCFNGTAFGLSTSVKCADTARGFIWTSGECVAAAADYDSDFGFSAGSCFSTSDGASGTDNFGDFCYNYTTLIDGFIVTRIQCQSGDSLVCESNAATFSNNSNITIVTPCYRPPRG